MISDFHPRFPYLTRAWAAAVLPSAEAARSRGVQLLETASPEDVGTLWLSLSGRTLHVGLIRYGIGAPLDEVRKLLHTSAQEMLAGLEIRGTGEGPESRKAPPPSDLSLGNACAARQGVHLALLSGDLGLAKGIAPFIWDPPTAKYVGPTSVLCTDKEQALAYASKFAVGGDLQAASNVLRRLVMLPENLVGDFKSMQAIVKGDSQLYLDGLSSIRSAHDREAGKKENLQDTTLFLNLKALGSTALALNNGVVTRAQLPPADVRYPVDILEAR